VLYHPPAHGLRQPCTLGFLRNCAQASLQHCPDMSRHDRHLLPCLPPCPAGMPTESEEEIVAAAHALRRQGVATVLVKLGARGSLLVGESGSVVGAGLMVWLRCWCHCYLAGCRRRAAATEVSFPFTFRPAPPIPCLCAAVVQMARERCGGSRRSRWRDWWTPQEQVGL
jgi:hypothetical protein